MSSKSSKASGNTSVQVSHQQYGKNRVRIVKVIRKTRTYHELIELNVCVQIDGELAESYTQADNTLVVPTDTMKNLVYVVAHKENVTPIEGFGCKLVEKILDLYSHVSKVIITVDQQPWQRMLVHGQLHEHSFVKGGEVRFAHVIGTRREKKITSGLKELTILKTTNSGFENFHHCKYTVLKDTKDRLLGTTIHATWTYTSHSSNIDYCRIYNGVKNHIFEAFTRYYSASVQDTAFRISQAIFNELHEIEEIKFLLPNIHNWIIDLSKFGEQNSDLFMPTDEPHGLIEVGFKRLQKSKL